MGKHDLTNEILGLIALKQEGAYWDFKREWYGAEKNADLLHDVICMANSLNNHDGYIVIGVDESDAFTFVDVQTDKNRRNTQNIVDFLREKKFAGDVRPVVYVEQLVIAAVEIDVIVIKNDRNTPYYLIESCRGVC
jgi:Divergent AAA domain.